MVRQFAFIAMIARASRRISPRNLAERYFRDDPLAFPDSIIRFFLSFSLSLFFLFFFFASLFAIGRQKRRRQKKDQAMKSLNFPSVFTRVQMKIISGQIDLKLNSNVKRFPLVRAT